MKELPILLVDNFFLFPKCINYLPLEENVYWKKILYHSWQEHDGNLLIIPNKDKFIEESEKSSSLGTLAKINLDIPRGTDFESILNSLKEIPLKGLERINLTHLEKRENIWKGEYEILLEKETTEEELDKLTEKFVRYLPNILEKCKLNAAEKVPYMTMIKGNVGNLIDFIAQNSKDIDNLTKWKILISLDLQERLEYLINLPDRQKIEKDIDEATREEIRKQQEQHYLIEKRRTIDRRLKNFKDRKASGEMRKYLERLEKEPYPEHVKKTVLEEIERYESMPSNFGESNIISQYVELLVNLPWWQKTPEINDLNFARKKLEEKHYGIKKIKERIIEYLAANQKANKTIGQVICLVGPPGVGKTSLASSIAEATGRKLVRISLGGVHDEAEIRGHRRTYVGAKPGKIIQEIKKSQVINPLFLIDEIDKISQFRGDPAYALLEVLDPNQNKNFVDNYLGEVPYDLSQVMFICTANDERGLPLPLLDRMEIIHLSSYTEIEKFHIAKEYLIPENLQKHNLTTAEISFQDQAIRNIIKYYTLEAGVRELNRKIQVIIRKFLVQLLQKEKEKLIVTPENLSDYLEKKDYEHTYKQKHPRPGVATGLAYTGYGGDILLIEVNCLPGGKGELKLTGNLGEIMKESAQAALSFIRVNHKKFGIKNEEFTQNDIHIHVPEGATPKEGPSAGVAITSAIISIFTGKLIPSDLGMTGEITSKGEVKKIGGLKEKAIAAHRSRLKTIVIPKSNENDIEDIPEEVRQELKIILVEEYEEVWKKIFGKKTRKISLPFTTTTKEKNSR